MDPVMPAPVAAFSRAAAVRRSVLAAPAAVARPQAGQHRPVVVAPDLASVRRVVAVQPPADPLQEPALARQVPAVLRVPVLLAPAQR